jgi:hypothetical protein
VAGTTSPDFAGGISQPPRITGISFDTQGSPYFYVTVQHSGARPPKTTFDSFFLSFPDRVAHESSWLVDGSSLVLIGGPGSNGQASNTAGSSTAGANWNPVSTVSGQSRCFHLDPTKKGKLWCQLPKDDVPVRLGPFTFSDIGVPGAVNWCTNQYTARAEIAARYSNSLPGVKRAALTNAFSQIVDFPCPPPRAVILGADPVPGSSSVAAGFKVRYVFTGFNPTGSVSQFQVTVRNKSPAPNTPEAIVNFSLPVPVITATGNVGMQYTPLISKRQLGLEYLRSGSSATLQITNSLNTEVKTITVTVP